jgi:murein DD-endopeptidase MepM/ murein hydrolase activator NlpD
MRSARRLAIILLLCLAGSAASSTYTLKWGDTLGRVAAKYHVPLAALTATNKIATPNKVPEGLTIQIPDPKAAQVAVARPISTTGDGGAGDGALVYTVKAGDTLSSIASRAGVKVADIVSLNRLKSANALIREGRDLKLPAGANADAAAATTPAAQQPLCPVQGAGKFDFSNSFGSAREGNRHHQGNDIFAKVGTPVVAPVSGTVRPADGSRAGIAWYLDGDSGVTYYGAHMNSRTVKNGRVDRGDVLGTVGITGNAAGTPAHLHFEVHPGGGDAVDPFKMLQAWCH